MLIKLDTSLLTQIDEFSSDEWSAVDLLARCHGEGKHLLIVSRNLAQRLASSRQHLSPYSASIYDRIYQKSATNKFPISTHIKHLILVHKDASKVTKSSPDPRVIDIPLNRFRDTEKIQPAYLLCENLADCNAYISLARKYMQKISLRGVDLSFRQCNGGGQTTEHVFKTKLAEKTLIVCIIDSDKNSQNSPLGQTSRMVKKMYKSLKHDQSALVILNARELENLLPDVVLESNWPSERPEKASIIRQLSLLGQGESRLYLDLKAKGLFFGDILNTSRSAPQGFGYIGGSNHFPNVLPDCLSSKICSSRGACKCSLLPPLGASTLSRSIEIIDRINHSDLFQGLSSAHNDELSRILEIVIDFGIANRRVSC